MDNKLKNENDETPKLQPSKPKSTRTRMKKKVSQQKLDNATLKPDCDIGNEVTELRDQIQNLQIESQTEVQTVVQAEFETERDELNDLVTKSRLLLQVSYY